jgi:TIR domain/NB-ARC domain
VRTTATDGCQRQKGGGRVRRWRARFLAPMDVVEGGRSRVGGAQGRLVPEPRARIFLSYARGDDEPFVKRLYERLDAESFDVWWDRVRMPSRALTFLKEIREAVRAADRVVVVIGPRCVASDYCRAEWQAALAESKVVNPLLRLGEHTLLPPELAGLHCPDLTDDARFEQAFEEVVRVLTEPIPPLGALLGGVPDVPPHFQPRPGELSRLAAEVLLDESAPVVLTGPRRVTMLHGMGGVGKSVLAASFARATTTRRSFMGGVFWLAAGEQTAPAALTAALGGLLGESARDHADLSFSTTRLAAALSALSALIVVDNAWRVEQIEPLVDALGPSCRLLVTSRSAALAAATGARSLRLDVLGEAAALQHLADWSGVAPGDLTRHAQSVAQECGYLPFALALNGAMHARGVGWSELLAALRDAEIDYAELRFKGYPHPTVLSSIKVSMDALDTEDPAAGARLRELAAFHPEGGIPEAAIATVWAHTGGLAVRHVAKLLARLGEQALVRLEGEPPARRVLIHDLQYAYLARLTDAAARNASLLAAYEQACGGEWTRVAGDGYIHRHLVQHLLDADEASVVYALIDDPTWRTAQLAYDSTASAYLDDLYRAWSLAADIDTRAARDGLTPPFLRREIDCALTVAEVHSLFGHLPPALIDELVKLDLWSPEQAMSAGGMSDVAQQVEALIALAARLPEPERADSLTSARRSAGSIPEPLRRVKALVALAPHLPEADRIETLTEALSAAGQVADASERVEALTSVAPHLPEPDRARALTEAGAAIRSMPFAQWRIYPLIALAPHLPEPDRSAAIAEAFAAVQTMSVFTEAMSYDYARALMELAPHLSATQLDTAMGDAANIAIFGDHWYYVALGTLAAHVPEPDRAAAVAEAFSEAKEESDPSIRAEALVTLAPHLTDGQLAEALATATDVTDPSVRAEVLGDLAPHLSSTQLSEALTAAIEIPDAGALAKALAALAPHLTAYQLDRALRAAQVINDAASRAGALTAISRLMSGSGRSTALTGALSAANIIVDPKARVEALANLVTLLQETERSTAVAEALAALRLVTDPLRRADALGKLAPYITELQLASTLSAATEDQYWRAGVLVALAPYLPEPDRSTALTDALAAVSAVSHPSSRAELLVELAPHLPARELAHAVRVAADITAPSPRVDALAALAPRLRGAELVDALNATLAIDDPYSRAHAIPDLAPYLTGEELADALAATRAMTELIPRAEALAALAPRLATEDVAREFADTLAGTTSPYEQEAILTSLAPHLAAEQLADAVATAGKIAEPEPRAEALAALASQLAEPGRRHALEQALAATGTIVNTYARAKALAALAPHLAEDQLAEALAAAGEIGDGWRAEALSALAPYLGREQLSDALAATGEIADARPGAEAFAALAPHLAAEQLADAVAAAGKIAEPEPRAEALAALASQLAEPGRRHALEQALAATGTIVNTYARAKALAALAPHLAEDQLAEALAAAGEIGDGSRVEALSSLAPYLSGEQLADALAIAGDIPEPDRRADAFAALAPHLAAKQLADALAAAREIAEPGSRAVAIAALAVHLDAAEPLPLRRYWDEALRAAATGGSQGLATAAPSLAQLLGRVTDFAASQESSRKGNLPV